MTDARLALIHFVTSRQTDLQGLRDVAFAISVLAMLPLMTWLSRSLRDAPTLLGLLVLIAAWSVASTGSAYWIDRWYGSRYGRVNASGVGLRRSTTAQMLMGLGVALDLTPWFPYFGISAFVLVVAIHGVWIAFRDFPWRGYHLLTVALIGLAPRVEDGARMLGYFPAYAAVLICLAVVGCLDHRLLRSSIGRLQRQPEEVGSSS
jgi:hypothetical protein